MKQDLESVSRDLLRMSDHAAHLWEMISQEQERSYRLEQRLEALEGAEQRERAKSFEAERVRSEWLAELQERDSQRIARLENADAHAYGGLVRRLEERIDATQEVVSIIMRERLKESDSRENWRDDVMAALSQVEGGHEAMLAEGARRAERQLKIDTEACGCEGAPECQLHYR